MMLWTIKMMATPKARDRTAVSDEKRLLMYRKLRKKR
jgi:hypothetical protein